jgi:hypothetical protein
MSKETKLFKFASELFQLYVDGYMDYIRINDNQFDPLKSREMLVVFKTSCSTRCKRAADYIKTNYGEFVESIATSPYRDSQNVPAVTAIRVLWKDALVYSQFVNNYSHIQDSNKYV